MISEEREQVGLPAIEEIPDIEVKAPVSATNTVRNTSASGVAK